MSVVNVFVGFWILISVDVLLSFGLQIMLALAVFYDAKARGNSEPLMWALLVGLLGLVPGVIYLCMRDSAKNRMIVCPQCHAVHAIGLPNCPQCGVYNPYCYPFCNPEIPMYAKKAKTFFIIAMILLAVTVIVMFVAMWIMIVGMVSQAG